MPTANMPTSIPRPGLITQAPQIAPMQRAITISGRIDGAYHGN